MGRTHLQIRFLYQILDPLINLREVKKFHDANSFSLAALGGRRMVENPITFLLAQVVSYARDRTSGTDGGTDFAADHRDELSCLAQRIRR